jgi:hypothetical protein
MRAADYPQRPFPGVNSVKHHMMGSTCQGPLARCPVRVSTSAGPSPAAGMSMAVKLTWSMDVACEPPRVRTGLAGKKARSHYGRVLVDHDFHPDEPTVRIFRTPSPGVLRLDDSVAVSQAVYDGVVLWHYAFGDHWFKVNVTTDLAGVLTETGDGTCRFAVNCDIATPMEREAGSTFAVDLFTDVLVRQDAMCHAVAGQDEFAEMLGRGVISPAEGRGAERGLRELLALIETGRLLGWLGELAPFGPCQPPQALPMQRGPVPRRLRPGVRRTW